MTLRIGTRGSQLALFQANAVATLLRDGASIESEIVVIRTSGDRLAEATLAQIGGKRLFVKEIEDALLAGEVDLAVHSSKDMPAVLPEGLDVAAVLPREDARDALVLPEARTIVGTIHDVVEALGRAPRIGTSSVRRSAQLIRLFPGAHFAPVRGNLDTRLRKVDAGDFDAIVLAAAGLRRLQHADRISVPLPVDACIPAPGQGIIAVEIRSADDRVRALLRRISDRDAEIALAAERAVVTRLGGGCQMPIGAYATVDGDHLSVIAVVVSPDGARAERAHTAGSASDAAAVGTAAADGLLEAGAGEILEAVKQAQAAVEGIQP